MRGWLGIWAGEPTIGYCTDLKTHLDGFLSVLLGHLCHRPPRALQLHHGLQKKRRAEMHLVDDRLREMNQKELERQPKNAAKHVVQRWAKRRALGCEK